MQTRDENLNDLIEALTVSNSYRRQQERRWKQAAMHNCVTQMQEGHSEKFANMH